MGTIADIIAAAAQRYGQNPDTARGIATIESHLNPNAQNPRSSAGGLFQFIDSTAGHYGLVNKFDPAANADAGAHLMRDNNAFLQQRLGRAPTPGETYLAHQQGAAGAAKILANPDADAAATVGQRAFSLNGGVPSMTNGQFSQLWADRLAKALGQPATGGAGAAAAPAPGGRTPQAGSDLAAALPGATLPTGAFVLPVPTAPDPVATTAASVADGFQRQKQADATDAAARRTALFGGRGGLGALYG